MPIKKNNTNLNATKLLNELLKEVKEEIGNGISNGLIEYSISLGKAGAGPVKILDEVLFMLLHKGEKDAIRKGAGLSEPSILREIVCKYANYPKILMEGGCNNRNELRNRRKNIQCMVTRRCNLRCSYCPVLKNDEVMGKDVLFKTLDLLLSSSEENLRLDFTGGEPLYSFDVVMSAMQEGVKKADSLSKKLSFYMVTNGTMLTRDIAIDLKKFPLLLEISLDGKREEHNRFKKPVNVTLDPYFETCRAIEILLEENVPFYVVMVASPQNVCKLSENFDHIISLGVRSIDVNYAIGSLWSPGNLSIFFDEVNKIIDKYKFRIKAGEITLGNITRRSEPSILNAEWMVDTDGSLHLMTEWVFQSSFPYDSSSRSWGNVQNLISFDALYADRFHAYLELLESSGWRDKEKRKIIQNNIKVGVKVGNFFKEVISRNKLK